MFSFSTSDHLFIEKHHDADVDGLSAASKIYSKDGHVFRVSNLGLFRFSECLGYT